ncbi:MAG: hypothetical protein U0M42_00860 [Acutalibacteraceae bacterium]|nr:hypothetical protein [Acutalibacteraceae bacterium]
MSDYVNKRIDYINNWPNGTPFEAEKNYEKRCKDFIDQYGRQPFSVMKLWADMDNNYNRAISHFIDSIDVMPYHPNFAFNFVFSALDYYSSTIYSSSKITTCFKKFADDLVFLINQNSDISDLMKALFSAVPVSATMYLYKCLCGLNPTNKAYRRVTTDNSNNRNDTYRKNIVDAIKTKYGPDTANRDPGLLYRKIFNSDSINIDGTKLNITNSFKIHLLLSGIIYSLRNDSLHGSSMSSTKSSKTTPKRYAMNYYCYLATYTLLMIILVMNSSLSDIEKNSKYTEMKNITLRNVIDFRDLFGHHIK